MLPPPELTHHPGLFSPIIPVRTRELLRNISW
jgi:hypothetical protein